jgi:16S rRNA (adenine1518-N6/adenine1519-N6)-dimethyltransferase
VLEIGAGLGSLTVALAESGAEVVAVERDPRLLPALEEVVAGLARVRVVAADALDADWRAMLGGGSWSVVANLPYNVAVPVLMRILKNEPSVERLVVMVQREVGERLAAGPGHPQYGAVSVRVAYLAEATLIRRVPASVFWPRPTVESVVVRLDRRDAPPVSVDREALWRVIEVAFGQRRKTMRGAMIRLGMGAPSAEAALADCGIGRDRRPEELGLESFACLAERWLAGSRELADP